MKILLRGILPVISLILLLRFAGAASAEAPEHAYGAVLMEAQSGMCLGGTDPERILPVGTQTKLMTVYLTAEAAASGRLDPAEQVTVSPAAEGAPGATVWLLTGERMTVSDLLKAVIIGNANDACIALACRLSGSEMQFVREMNAAAFTLGMRHTRFADCTGMSAENTSTAHDLALLCRALLEYDFLTPYFTAWREELRGGATELVSENRLTKKYQGLLGCKAGHGDASGYTLTAAAERGQLRMIAVVLGSEDDDARFSEAEALLKHGFTGYYVTTPDFQTEFLHPLKVRHGTADSVLAETGELLSLALPKGERISSTVVLPRWRDAPVRKGDVIGSAAFYCGDTLVSETPLLAAEDVPRRTFRDTLRMLLHAMFR